MSTPWSRCLLLTGNLFIRDASNAPWKGAGETINIEIVQAEDSRFLCSNKLTEKDMHEEKGRNICGKCYDQIHRPRVYMNVLQGHNP